MSNKTSTHIFERTIPFNLSSMESLTWNKDVPNYKFLGWTTNPDGSGEKYADAERVTFDEQTKGLYAQWQRDTYTIIAKANDNGNIQLDDSPITKQVTKILDVKHVFHLVAIPDNGYELDFWSDGSKELDRYIEVKGNAEYEALFKLHEYKIKYELNGGENSPNNPSTYTLNSPTIIFEAPIKKGYAGFFSPASIEHGSSGDKGITANFELINYEIIYILDGGENSPNNPETYTVESNTIVFEDPIKKGYIGHFDPPSIQKGTAKQFITNAQYEIIQYNIAYELNGGENSPYNPSTYTVEDGIVFQLPIKEGYIGRFDPPSIPKGSTGDITVKAFYEPVSYTIDYLLNGGTHSGNPTSYTSQDNIVFNSPTKEGYNKGEFDPPSILKGSTGNKIVTASYSSPISYSISYKLNGGTHSGNPTSYNVESNTITFNRPSKTGYNYGYFNPSSIPSGSTGNKKITAYYSSPTSYNISYELNGHGTAPSKTSYTIEEEYTPPSLTADNYTFLGWSPTKINRGNTGDVTFTAGWRSNSFIDGKWVVHYTYVYFESTITGTYYSNKDYWYYKHSLIQDTVTVTKKDGKYSVYFKINVLFNFVDSGSGKSTDFSTTRFDLECDYGSAYIEYVE